MTPQSRLRVTRSKPPSPQAAAATTVQRSRSTSTGPGSKREDARPDETVVAVETLGPGHDELLLDLGPPRAVVGVGEQVAVGPAGLARREDELEGHRLRVVAL